MEEQGLIPRTHKPNLGTVAHATERRREENISIRKEKRSEKLKKQRVVRVEPSNSSTVSTMIEQQFNRAALAQHSVEQLKLLSQILGKINQDELEKYYERLFGMDGGIIRILVQAMQVESISVDASTCLANLTGNLINEDYRLNCAKHLMDARIFDSIRLLLDRPDIKDVYRGTLWTIACNFAYSCREAVQILFSSCLVQEGAATSPLLAEVRADRRAVAYPLMDILRNLLEAYADQDVRYAIKLPPELIRIMYHTLCVHSGEPLEVSQGRVQNMDEDEREMVPCCLRGLWIIFQTASEEQSAWFAMQENPTWTMLRIFNKYTLMLENTHMQMGIMKVYNLFCAISVENHFIPQKLLQNNSVHLFIQAAQSLNKEVQRNALFCLGSFMSESSQFVKIAMLPPFLVMHALVPALRHRAHLIKIAALYCVMTMFGIAEEERKQNMATRSDCEHILKSLIIEHRLFRIIMPYLNTMENVQVVMDVLSVIRSALAWNKSLVMQALDISEGADAVGKLMNDVHTLRGNQHTELYKLAGEVDDMLSQGDMEVEYLDLSYSTNPTTAAGGGGGGGWGGEGGSFSGGVTRQMYSF